LTLRPALDASEQIGSARESGGSLTGGTPWFGREKLNRRTTYCILALAVLVNAGMLLIALPAASRFLSPNYTLHFEDLYDQIGNNVAEGNGYRIEPDMGLTMMREPGYPLFLALVFKIAGHRLVAARLANVLLAMGVVLLLMRLTYHITGDGAAALLAPLLFLFYPGTLIAEARGGVEIGFIFVVMLFMLFLYHAIEKGNLWRFWIAGTLLGAATLMRSEILSFPLFLLVYLILAAQGAARRYKAFIRIAALSLGLGVAISPWIIRNYILTREFVPTASVAGMAAQEGLYTCQHLSLDGAFAEVQLDAGKERARLASQLGIPFVGRYYYQLFYKPVDELKFSRALLNGTVAKYRADPMLLARCGEMNFLFNFWFLGKNWKTTWLNMALQAPLLVLGTLGVVLLRRRGLLRKCGPILAFILYVPSVHAPIIAHARHSMATVPFLVILASVPLVAVWSSLQARRRKGEGIGSLPTLANSPHEPGVDVRLL